MTPSGLPGISLRSSVLAAGVLLLALALRLWGIAAGAPYRMAIDESFVVGPALQILRSGDFNPHFFDYGGLAIYLHTAVAAVRFLDGALDRQWASLDQIWIGEFLVASRVVTAVLGAMTVGIVFQIGRRLGEATALVGALVMAILPPAVRESHFALTDTPLTMLVAMTLLLSIRAVESRRLPALLLAGLAAGLTAAVKYNGALAIVLPLLAATAVPLRRQAAAAAVVCGGAALGFLAGAPYSLFDLPGFLSGFAGLMQSYNNDRPFSDAATIYVKYLRNWFTWPGVLPAWLGYPGLIVAVTGLGVVAVSRRFTALDWRGRLVLLVFPVVYFVFISRQGSLQYGRYLLPLAPMLSLGLAAGLVGLRAATRSLPTATRRLGLALLAGVVLLPAATSVAWDREQTYPHTEELTSAWLVANAGRDEVVAVEASAILLPPQIQVRPVQRLIDSTIDEYREQGVTYLVSTSTESDRYFTDPGRRAEELAAYRDLLAQAEVEATFATGRRTPGPSITILRLRQ